MNIRSYDKLTLLFAATQFLAASNALIVMAATGWDMPDGMVTQVKPLFLIFGVLAGLSGLIETLGAYKRGDWYLAVKAVGVLVASVLLVDLWYTSIRFDRRIVVMIVLVGVSALPILVSQIYAIVTERKKGQTE